MIEHPTTKQVLFSRGELASDDGTVRLAPGFQAALRDLRLDFGRPMRVNSCCRTPEHNKRVGGASSSFHLTEGNPLCEGGTCAIDIAVPDGGYRHKLMTVALAAGWSVGNYKTFIHLDRRTDYGQTPVAWWG
jgi:hypothetical protein